MHMSDAIITPAVAITMYATSVAAGAYSMKKINFMEDKKKIPLMSVMGAFVFASQMINFTIPGTGSSGHLTGGLLLAAILGPYAAFITMSVILTIQCLLFADGGILALGCNIWNLGFYSCILGYYCIYKPMISRKISRLTIIISSILGSIICLQLGAFSVSLQTLLSGITELPFREFIMVMQPIHLGIGLVEGLITSAVLVFIYESRPDILTYETRESKVSFKKIIFILSLVVILIGGGLSLFASSNPDGLEWSMEQVAEDIEIESVGEAHAMASNIQNTTAILPDYNFANSGEETLGTSFSGVIGSIFVCLSLIGICRLLKKLRKV